MMCDSTGGVSCNNCSNVVIEGITWDQYGDPKRQNLYGEINFHISNLVVQNCIFQQSKVRALSLFTLSGFVYILNSYFVSNANYDTIFCYSSAAPGYKVCGTAVYAATGGMLIKNNITATNGNDIYICIHKCIFNNNSFMGNVKHNTISTCQLHFGAGLSIEY